jgi:glycine dehydrogenase subunit 1
VRVPDARSVHRRLIDRGVLAGLALADILPDEPSLADGLLVCATEITTDDEIALFASALSEELAGAGARAGVAEAVR